MPQRCAASASIISASVAFSSRAGQQYLAGAPGNRFKIDIRREDKFQRPRETTHICSFFLLNIMIHSPYGSIIAGSQLRRPTAALRRKYGLYPYRVDRLAGCRAGSSEACQGRMPPVCQRLRPCAGIPKSYRQPPAFSRFRPENCVYCPKSTFPCPTLSVSDNIQTENKYTLGVAAC